MGNVGSIRCLLRLDCVSILIKILIKFGNPNPLSCKGGFVISVGGTVIMHVVTFYVTDVPHHSA